MTPKQWGGSGVLGASVRFDTADPADCNGIRVLEVFPGSPAAHAGHQPGFWASICLDFVPTSVSLVVQQTRRTFRHGHRRTAACGGSVAYLGFVLRVGDAENKGQFRVSVFLC